MNHPSDSIRTDATRNLLKQVDGVLNHWQGFDFTHALDATGLAQITRNVDRARRQFDSKLFFVVIFGPLKAGKSTLTNTLAGDYVSPTGFGKETTLRPSLVIRAEESGIDQYFSMDPDVSKYLSKQRQRGNIQTKAVKENGEIVAEESGEQITNKVHEDFDAVADFLRGIRSKDEFQGRIRASNLPLNVQNLEQALTQSLTAEPLLTVIRCKGGHLLSHGVAVVDMPGLDGSRSNWKDDPIHEWVIKRAEFFLFVQSSVAALNNQTEGFLNEIVAHGTKPPIWLVQNIFDARHWQPEEKKKKAEDDQREDGKRRFIELLNQTPMAVLGLNLGLAWDATCEDPIQTEWLARSNFPKFEADLAEVLHASRAMIQERQHLKTLNKSLAEAKGQLGQIANAIEDIRRSHKLMRENLGAAEALLNAVNYRSDWESALRGEIATIAEETSEQWLASLENEVGKLRERHKLHRTGKEVNDDLKIVEVRLAAEGDSKHFAKSPLLPQYVSLGNKYCKSAEGEAVARCNELLSKLNKLELPTPISPSVDDLPSLQTDVFTSDKLQEKKRWLGCFGKMPFDKEHDPKTIGDRIEHVSIGWRQQIHARKEIWKNQLLTDHFSTYCEKRRNHFRAYLQRLLADFETQARFKEEAATVAENFIQQMNEAVGNLELPLANATASMK